MDRSKIRAVRVQRKHQEMSAAQKMFLLSFLLPVIVYAGLFIGRSIYPGGTSLYLYSDMYHQYAPFLAEFRYKILHGEGLSYSFNIGLGTNFTTLYAYYAASPFNWLCILLPQSWLVDFMDFFIMIKGGLAALTFSYYINKHFGKTSPIICAVSLFYACSGYWAAYCWCTMWLDCIVLLPLIILGIERLVDQNSCTLYGVTLGLCIFTNYYLSIMVCITSVLYFLYCLALMKGKNKGKRALNAFLHFILYSLLAAGMAGVLLLPEIYTFSLSASADSTFPTVLSQYFPFTLMISRHIMGIPVTFGEKYPNIFCSVAVLFLLPLYVVSTKYSAKQKIARCLLLLVFLFSFNINVFDYIWHGFHYPNSLSCRQSFIYIFFVLVTAFEAIQDFRNYSMKEIAGAAGIACGLLFYFEQIYAKDTSSYKDTYQYDFRVIYLSLLFIIGYVILMALARSRRFSSYVCTILVIVVCISEATMNLDMTGLSKVDRAGYLSDNATLTSLINTAKEKDPSFWRMEKLYGARTKNDGAWSHYPSASVFSSTANDGVMKLFQAMGLESSMNAYNYTGSTALTSALFDVKYLLSSQAVSDPFLTQLASEDGYYLYENNEVLPVGFMVPDTLESNWSFDASRNAIETQNDFAYQAAGVSNLFEKIGTYPTESSASVSVSADSHVYFVVGSNQVSSVTLAYSSDGSSRTVNDLHDGNKVVDAGYVRAGETITISADQSMNLTAWTMNEDKLRQTVSTLSQNGLGVTSHSSNSIRGTINASQAGTLLLTIPYDAGWSIRIDGQVVEPEAFKKALLSVPVSAGTHSVELVFHPKNLGLGIFISLLSLFLLWALWYLKKRISSGRCRRLPTSVEHFFLDSDIVIDSSKTTDVNKSTDVSKTTDVSKKKGYDK